MNIRRSHRVLLPLAAGLLVFSSAGPALAVSAPAPSASPTRLPGPDRCAPARLTARADPTVAHLQAFGDCEVDRRLETVSDLQAVVAGSATMTEGDRNALGTELVSTSSSLTVLRATIDADTTVAALRTDLARIVTDERVYVLVGRQVFLVRAADTVDVTAVACDPLAATLQTRIDAAPDPATRAAAQARLDAMQAAVASARADVDGLAATLLPLTPADWNDGSAKPVLDAARSAIGSARSSLREALTDAREVIATLG